METATSTPRLGRLLIRHRSPLGFVLGGGVCLFAAGIVAVEVVPSIGEDPLNLSRLAVAGLASAVLVALGIFVIRKLSRPAALYEGGIRAGGRTFPWSDVDRVTYADPSYSGDAHENSIEHFTLILADGTSHMISPDNVGPKTAARFVQTAVERAGLSWDGNVALRDAQTNQPSERVERALGALSLTSEDIQRKGRSSVKLGALLYSVPLVPSVLWESLLAVGVAAAFIGAMPISLGIVGALTGRTSEGFSLLRIVIGLPAFIAILVLWGALWATLNGVVSSV